MAKDKVIVGCKLPNGLEIHAGETVVTLKGANASNIVGGHGLTEVDAEFWAKWIESNKDFAPVAAGLIFANETYAKTKDEANEKIDNESGFEGIDPANPGGSVAPANDKDE